MELVIWCRYAGRCSGTFFCMKACGNGGCEICKATFDGCMYLHIIVGRSKINVLPIGRINVMIRANA